jgi:hypothetical protein
MNVRLLFIPLAAVVALLAPAAAAEAAKKSVYPSIKKIEPLNLSIGETMTIKGRNYLAGKNRNTVVFKRKNQRAIFAKAHTATRTKLTVVVPEKLRPYLAKLGDAPIPTKFQVRILSKRFGKKYTAMKASPVIAPIPAGGTTGDVLPINPVAPPAPADCDNDGIIDDNDDDDDNDHMSDAFEAVIKTDKCLVDTDGDGSSDFWEYQSALDLNLRALPYPGKRPYPNPLFHDSAVDYDGDGMYAWQEHLMWVRYGNGANALNYSDGTQRTDPSSGTTDDNRDVDADGLGNWDEANGRFQRDWWTGVVTAEKPYGVEFGSLDFVDSDSDGDGRLDGDDDIDHDGYSNRDDYDRMKPLPDKFDESLEPVARWVQPFNPCLPDPESPTCSLHPPAPLSNSWPPFDVLGFPVSEDIPRPIPMVIEDPEEEGT